jgi:hypothetical protein
MMPAPTAKRLPPTMFPLLLGMLLGVDVALLDELLDTDVDNTDGVVAVEDVLEEVELLKLVMEDEAGLELEEPGAEVDEAEDGRPVPVDWIPNWGE